MRGTPGLEFIVLEFGPKGRGLFIWLWFASFELMSWFSLFFACSHIVPVVRLSCENEILRGLFLYAENPESAW